MTQNTKAALMYGGIAVGVVALYLIFKKKSSAAAIVAAKNTAAGVPAATVTPVTGGSLGNTPTPPVPSTIADPLTPTVIQTPAGKISTVPLSFATPTADALYFAPQNSL